MTKSRFKAALAAMVLISAAAACSIDVHEKALTPEVLEDQEALSSISNRLEPDERELFNKYVLNRTIGSRIMPGQAIVKDGGRDPETVAEALVLMRAWTARQKQIDKLEAERDAKLKAINDRRDLLPVDDVANYNDLVEQHNDLTERYQAQMDALRQQPLGVK